MATNRGILVDHSAPQNIRLTDLPEPTPALNEAVIRVAATSLNRGELRMAAMGANGRRIGWDFAGTVERAAPSGLGPMVGARVVGMLSAGSWAERIAAPTEALALLPERVSFAQAATLPVAGLTALYGLEKAAGLIGRKVLITGGTGGVGNIAIQLARLGGAYVISTARSKDKAAVVREAGAHEVAIGDEPAAITPFGPYDLVLDGVGGPMLGTAMANLAKNGTCVIYGTTAGGDVSVNIQAFYATGGAQIYGFILFHELLQVPAGIGLGRLASLVATGALRPRIDTEVPLAQIGELAQQLIDRTFTGKAVITF